MQVFYKLWHCHKKTKKPLSAALGREWVKVTSKRIDQAKLNLLRMLRFSIMLFQKINVFVCIISITEIYLNVFCSGLLTYLLFICYLLLIENPVYLKKWNIYTSACMLINVHYMQTWEVFRIHGKKNKWFHNCIGQLMYMKSE